MQALGEMLSHSIDYLKQKFCWSEESEMFTGLCEAKAGETTVAKPFGSDWDLFLLVRIAHLGA